MSTALTAEALMATTGLWPTKPPEFAQLLAAESVPDAYRKRLERWLRSPQKPGKWRPPPENQEKLQAKVIAPLDQDEVTGWLTTLGDHEVGMAYALAISNARKYLDGAWPKIMIPGVVPEIAPLSQDDYAEEWSLVTVVDDAESFFDELDSWQLTTTQVAAFKACYPELYAMVVDLLQMALIDFVAKGKRPVWQQEELVRIVRGLQPEAAIEIPTTPEGEPAQPKAKAWEIDFAATRTPSDRLQAKGAGVEA